jgi:transcriptional regulator with XRE-family HTH domain
LNQLGERIRSARRRRGLPAALVAERAGMSLMTLRGIEHGRPGTTIGAYTAVLRVLGLDADLDAVAATDPIGRDLQDANLKRRQRVKT